MAEANTKKTDGNEDEPLGPAGMRALESERSDNKALRKELQQLKDKLQSRDDADLSEVDKWKKKAGEYKAALEKHERDAELAKYREELAEEFGIPPKLIRGDDRDALRESAQDIKGYLDAETAPRKPKPVSALGKTEQPGDNSSAEEDALSVLGFGVE